MPHVFQDASRFKVKESRWYHKMASECKEMEIQRLEMKIVV